MSEEIVNDNSVKELISAMIKNDADLKYRKGDIVKKTKEEENQRHGLDEKAVIIGGLTLEKETAYLAIFISDLLEFSNSILDNSIVQVSGLITFLPEESIEKV